MAEKTPQNPTDDPTPPQTPPKSGFEVDADGNVRGIWFTMQVDKFVEFTDEVIPLTPTGQSDPKPDA
jgi:hypothetical protein